MLIRSRFMRFVQCAALLTAVLPLPGWAWGRIGHRVVARMAEERLNPRARAGVAGLLGPGVRLADIALWADEQQEIRRAGGWHSVDVPLSDTRYDSRYCSPGGCVVSKTEEF